MGNSLLKITVFLVLFMNLLTSVYLVSMVDSVIDQPTAAAVARVSICLNAQPSIIIPCNVTLSQDQPYTCQLNVTDLFGDYNHTYTALWLGTSIFSLSSTGLINFTPDNDDVGNHTVTLVVSDNTGCDTQDDSANFSFSIANINDPPVLLSDLPDIEFAVDTTTLAYFLSDYFYDPDGDVLIYTATIPGAPFVLTLIGGVGVQVTADSCGGEDDFEAYVQFTATDPFNASATSNLVKFKVECPNDDDNNQGDDSPGDGGGGGSGGGAGSICESEWECLGWMTCLPTGFQWEQCYDLHGCKDPKFLKRECTYLGEFPTCEENWLCEEWGPCYANKTQYRSCEDLNYCGSSFYEPFVEQKCIYLPTCSDGLKNGDETDVDCGGSCAACSIIETPEFISPAKFNLWLLIVMLLALILVGGVYRLYHEEIVRATSWVLLRLTHKRKKEILLTTEERNLFFERLLSAEKLVSRELPAAEKYARITETARDLFQTLGHVPEHFTRDELAQSLHARKMSEELQHMLLGLFDKIYAVEEHSLQFDSAFFFSLTEELRLYVCAISEYSVQDIERPLVEFETNEEMSFLEELFIRLVRVYRALQFDQFVFAKKEYDLILQTYENLPLEDRTALFGETSHVFTLLKYSLERADLES